MTAQTLAHILTSVQFTTSSNGQRLAVLGADDWESLMEWLEDVEDRQVIQAAPGHIRQRLKQAMLRLGDEPRPPESTALDWPRETFEPRRMRIGDWRMIYAVSDAEQWVEVLALRKRPPYDHGHLAELLSCIG